MRKVSKLALAFVALASFLCFLLYKSRYDRLYSMLEVLEFFGNGNQETAAPWRISHPPSWQRLTNQLHAYSAYCSRLPGSDDICSVVILVALANLNPLVKSNDLKQLTCQLWYDSSIQPVSVPITTSEAAVSTNVEELEKDRNPWKAFILNCESKFSNVLPFGVALGASPNSSSEEDFKGYLHVQSTVPASIDDVLACIAPQKSQVDSTNQALETVILNAFYGIKYFHIYDHGLTNRFVETLSHFARANHVDVAILPWNVPDNIGDKKTQYLVEIDCHLRAKALGFNTNVVLSGSQVLVPKSEKSVKTALEMSMKKGHLLVDVLKFCSEYPEEPLYTKRQINALSQTVFNSQLSSGSIVKVNHKSGSDEIRISKDDELAVHDYGPCNSYDMDVKGPESVRDRTISKQAAEIERLYGSFFPLMNN